MSQRGKFGIPFRAPGNAGGWPAFPPAYSDCYQNRHKTTWPRFKNTTQHTLQNGVFGRPDSRAATDNDVESVAFCPHYTRFANLPRKPWIGVGDDQYLLSEVQNTFTENLTNDFGKACRARGFKNLQSIRQWHGTPPWTSQEGCNTTICGADVSRYEPYRSTPNQTHYCTISPSMTVAETWLASGGNYSEWNATASGGVSVDASSGKLTSSLVTTQDDYYTLFGDPRYEKYKSASGAGFTSDGTTTTTFASGMTTRLDYIFDAHCANGNVPIAHDAFGGLMPGHPDDGLVSLEDLLAAWNAGGTGASPLPKVTDFNNYNQSQTWISGPLKYEITMTWARTATVHSWHLYFKFTNTTYGPVGSGLESITEYAFTGSVTLSSINLFSTIKSDAEGLLNYWPLNDDVLYPYRQDSYWQIAPKMSRDEYAGNRSPLGGFLPATLDDYRSALSDSHGRAPFTSNADVIPTYWTRAANVDDSGLSPGDDGYNSNASGWTATWTQMAWYDAQAYGFRFPYGRDQTNSQAADFVQFALTGKIAGMPMPRAFHDTNSVLYQNADAYGSHNDFQNFFDHRAEVWRATYCPDDGTGRYVNFYIEGYGQWLYDMISHSGAQLPHRCTQWTNFREAMEKTSYAYIIGADLAAYSCCGQPSSGNDFTAVRGDAVIMQKCVVIDERWPSENFFSPAGDDRFTFDETRVFCAANLAGSGVGSTWTLTDAATGIAPASGYPVAGENWGGSSVSGFYTVSAYNVGTGVVTLGAKVADVPTGWTTLFGDASKAFGKLRYFDKPGILGREQIASVTDNHDGTLTVALANAQVNVITGDLFDFFSVSFPLTGGIPCETMTAVASSLAVTRIDDTHFKVTTSLASISGATFVQTHGAPKWFWDDTHRKGDFVSHQWLYDFRTNGEHNRLQSVTDCGSNTPPTGTPATNYGYASFEQAEHSVRATPCYPSAIAISPNDEVFESGVTLGTKYMARHLDTGATRDMSSSSDLLAREVIAVKPFWPATFNYDARYGARWQAEIEQAMQTLLAQAPHLPCADLPDGSSSTAVTMDDGTCKEDYLDGVVWHYVYAHYQFVEARTTPPTTGGCAQNETAPTPPVTMGYLSPVTYNTGNVLYPPGQIGYDNTTGNPSTDWTYWQYRLTIETNCATCRFDYAGMENFPCETLVNPLPDDGEPDAPFGGLGGLE